jgi:hypothetical protein
VVELEGAKLDMWFRSGRSRRCSRVYCIGCAFTCRGQPLVRASRLRAHSTPWGVAGLLPEDGDAPASQALGWIRTGSGASASFIKGEVGEATVAHEA